MNKKYLLAVAAATLAGLSLTACGDDVTEVNEIHQDGMAVLDAGEKLSKYACDTTNVGEMLFVMDSSAAFVCDGKSWQALKGEKGKDGAKGEKGDKGAKGDSGKDGDNGTNCSAKSVKNKSGLEGVEVTCGETVIDTIWNGKDGENGKPGDPGKPGDAGTSCTAKSVKNKSGIEGLEVTCGETVVDTVWNGKDGLPGKDGAGCTLDDEGDGKVTVTCGKGDDATKEILYKAVCGTAAYDPAKSFCSEGGLYSCGDKPYDPVKQFCSEGEIYKMCEGKKYDPKTQYCLKVTRDETDIYSVEALLTDTRDMQVYKTVKICSGDKKSCQTWMAENLNYDPGDVSSMSEYAWSGCFDGEDENCSKYGRLYTWEVVMDNADCAYGNECKPSGVVQGICPEGWHVPTEVEFNTLYDNVSGIKDVVSNDGDEIVKKMLESASGWLCNDGVGNGVDAYGFSALPAGYRYFGNDYSKGESAYFWSASEDGREVVRSSKLSCAYNRDDISYVGYKHSGLSLRCLKD